MPVEDRVGVQEVSASADGPGSNFLRRPSCPPVEAAFWAQEVPGLRCPPVKEAMWAQEVSGPICLSVKVAVWAEEDFGPR